MQLKKIGHTKVAMKEAVMVTLLVIPLSIICVTLGGGGHAPMLLTLPVLFLFGPLFFLFPAGGMAGFFFAIFGTYPLYLIYGLCFAFLSGKHPTASRLFLTFAIFLQVGSGLLAYYLRFQ